MKIFRIFLFALFVSCPPALFAEVVDINHATAEKMARHLKGIGMSKARAIVDYRNKNGLFVKADELLNVKGIGEKILAANRKNISLGPKTKHAAGGD